MEYVLVKKTLNSKGTLVPYKPDLSSYVTDRNVDHYSSIFLYNEDHFNRFKQVGSVAGISDVVTDKLLWDLDNEGDPEEARLETITLVERLIASGIDKDSIQIAFSGNKGTTVTVLTNERFTPEEFKAITLNLAKGLLTVDPVVNNASRIIRMNNTRHQKSNLFKFLLSLEDIKNNDMKAIKEYAATEECLMLKTYSTVKLPASVLELKNVKPKIEVKMDVDFSTDISSLDWSKKPSWLSGVKYAIMQGFFDNGNRNNALMALGATFKSQGFDKDHTYRLLKGVAELQAKRTQTDRYPDTEIWNNIIKTLYSPLWKGGTYSPVNQPWMAALDALLPPNYRYNTESKSGETPHKIFDLNNSFKTYVENIDANTIKTGIPTLDENVFLSTGNNVGIVGAAGSGKTSMCLNLLNNTSKAGIKSVFASLDMSKNRMYEKVLYKVSGMNRKELYETFKNNKEAPILEKLKQEFGNVFFYSKSSPTVADVRNYILDCQEQSGERIKFVMLDYFERVSSDFSDDTASSKKVAAELQDMVNDLDICLITLLQPNKIGISGGPDTAIYDYTKIKGSSYVYQSMRTILSLWRPFYNPKDFSNDKYMQVAVLKNDLGELNEFVFGWNGARGEISELDDSQIDYFYQLIAQKEENSNKNKGFIL